MKFLNGKKTYAVGAALVTYLIVQAINGMEPDQNIVTGLLAGMGLTLRHGMK